MSKKVKKSSAAKKAAKKSKAVKKSKPAAKKRTWKGPGGSIGGFPRKCGVCQKKGHNSRSHDPGGPLAK